jgi:hypothetical protein
MFMPISSRPPRGMIFSFDFAVFPAALLLVVLLFAVLLFVLS